MNFIKKLFGKKKSSVFETPPAQSSAAAPPPPKPVQINEISPQELKTRLNNGNNVVVVDMRQGWEYQSGHIPSAVHMFIQEIPARMNELPKDTDIVFQCWHGNTSKDATAYLIQNGWDTKRVSSLSGGMSGWAGTFGQAGLVKE